MANFNSVFEGENKIQNLIKNDNNCSAHFDYNNNSHNNTCKLVVTTYNPKHKTHFLLHSIIGNNKIDALKEMYNHIYNLKKTLSKKNSPYLNYTIEWYNPDNNKKEHSSFYGENIQEVIYKFFYGKTNDNILIYNIKLNPNPCI